MCPCMQAKFCHFGKVDMNKYTQLWHMQQQEACSLAQQLLAADRVIHEQQLGWQWQPPDDSLFTSPHDAPQALSPTSAAAAAASGPRGSSMAGGGSTGAGSRQGSNNGGVFRTSSPGSVLTGSGRSEAARQSGAAAAGDEGSSRRGSRVSAGSQSGTSQAGGVQLHSPPEVGPSQRQWLLCA